MIKSAIQAARRMLHGLPDEPGGSECSSCGRVAAAIAPASRVLSANFTAWQALILGAGEQICDGCQRLLADPNLRRKIILCTVPGVYETIEIDLARVIFHEPSSLRGKFVLSLPDSHQKHHWLYAGLSSPDKILCGTDNRTIVFDRVAHGSVLDAVRRLLKRRGK